MTARLQHSSSSYGSTTPMNFSAMQDPRIDEGTIFDHAKPLFLTTGCPGEKRASILTWNLPCSRRRKEGFERNEMAVLDRHGPRVLLLAPT
jgi:hypothetical protein